MLNLEQKTQCTNCRALGDLLNSAKFFVSIEYIISIKYTSFQ